MSVFLLILKIIGIILAVIIGLILTAVLLVVFVPLRYKLNAAVDGQFEGGARVTWLLHLISAVFSFRDKEMSYAVRVLGIRLLSSEKSGKEEPEKTAELPAPEKPTKKSAPEKDTILTAEKNETVTEIRGPEKKEPEADSPALPEKKRSKPDLPAKNRGNTAPLLRKKEEIPVAEESITTEEDVPRKGIVVRFFEKLQELYGKAYDALQNLKCTFERFCDKLDSTREKAEEVLDLASDSRTKNALSHILKEIKLILKRVLPRRWDLSMNFGMEDPSLTGKILAALSVIYPFFPGKMEIEPDFSKQVIKGHTELKGHIRAAAFIGPAIRLLFDKNIRYVYKTWKSR